jgi:hypothetical protein
LSFHYPCPLYVLCDLFFDLFIEEVLTVPLPIEVPFLKDSGRHATPNELFCAITFSISLQNQ